MKNIYKIFNLPRPMKRLIQVGTDCALIALCFWLAMALRLDGLFTDIKLKSWLAVATIAPLTIFAFARLGLYRAVVRYMAEKAVITIVIGSVLSSVAMLLVSQYFELEVPRSVPGIYFSLLVVCTGGTRLLMRSVYLTSKDESRAPVVIYGAGEAGRLLMRSLQESRNYKPALFIDDDPRLQGTTISGTSTISFDQAKDKIARDGISIALIAVGDSNLELKRQASIRMAGLGLEVRTIPRLADMISGRTKISELRRVTIEEILGRDPVPPNPELMELTTKNKSVLITGAGGSIGGELCRQIIRQAPSCIVLIDISEYSLFNILEELYEIVQELRSDAQIVPIIGSVTQKDIVERAIIDHKVDTVFHAAAFKHVDLVENNAAQGLTNNLLGTYVTAQAAGMHGVKHFTLISSDKAVRPTNIMGATKRLAEIAVRTVAMTYPDTKFCSVRFGNVLGSSGSVVPKFERQISAGGPITVTHPEVTRYFMTIPEAAQLVIQASSMAKRGEIYLLDMGRPIRILDLAETLCSLRGLKLYKGNRKEAPKGQIGVRIIGLKPGEKLHEELLITGKQNPTTHPRIMSEASIDKDNIDVTKIIKKLSKLHKNEEVARYLASLPIDYSIGTHYQKK